MHPTHFEALYPDNSRELELSKVAQFLKEGTSCQVIGMPGAGRGNVVGFLAYNKAIREKHLGHLSQWFHFVMVNFSEVRNKPLFEVTKLMFLELVDSLEERGKKVEYTIVSDIFKNALSFQDELVLFQALKKAIDYLSIDKELTVIFLFERFETYISALTADFFNQLRVLRSRAKYRFSVIFSLTRPLEELIDPTLMADYYEFLAGHHVYLSLYDKPGLTFRLEYLAKVSGKTIDPQFVENVLQLTAGHGKLTKVCVEKALQADLLPQDATREFFLNNATVQGVLYEIWSFLSSQEQELLSQNPPQSTRFLENIQLIQDEHITIPLFADFITSVVQKELDSPLVYDETTNTIKRGATTISDNLTGAEFRLLRLLLQNKERVIERDEIVAAVWQENASTLGVSEQAIDQLVFRLRKKIEADPNQPQLIQTIKGRGIKLQSI